MSKQTYNNQRITEYLLGSLPDAETERLDELSITDNEFADRLRATENDLVDAYAQNELTGAELEQFKSFYLASPLRREKLEFATAFQRFGERESSDLSMLARGKDTTRGWFARLNALVSAQPLLRWGLAAAALALVIGGSWLIIDNLRLRQQMSQTLARRNALLLREQEIQKELEDQRAANSQAEQELARLRDERQSLEQELKTQKGGATSAPPGAGIASFIFAPPLRGPEQIRRISVPPGTRLVSIQLQLEAADYATYRVVLIDPANGQGLWHSGNLGARTKGDSKALAVSFPAGLLKPQNYILRVNGISVKGDPEILSDYPFRVVK